MATKATRRGDNINQNGQRRQQCTAERVVRDSRRRNLVLGIVVGLSYYVLLLLMISSIPLTNAATEVKWTASESMKAATTTNDGEKETAKTAPRSQKYWDENNIERPDYAKTDAELAQENGGGIGGGGSSKKAGKLQQGIKTVFFLLLIAFPVGYYVVWPRLEHGPGTRLGTTGGGQGTLFPSWLLSPLQLQPQVTAEEKARAARLSRFEAYNTNTNVKGD